MKKIMTVMMIVLLFGFYGVSQAVLGGYNCNHHAPDASWAIQCPGDASDYCAEEFPCTECTECTECPDVDCKNVCKNNMECGDLDCSDLYCPEVTCPACPACVDGDVTVTNLSRSNMW